MTTDFLRLHRKCPFSKTHLSTSAQVLRRSSNQPIDRSVQFSYTLNLPPNLPRFHETTSFQLSSLPHIPYQSLQTNEPRSPYLFAIPPKHPRHRRHIQRKERNRSKRFPHPLPNSSYIRCPVPASRQQFLLIQRRL
jgi:hypothetical protein